MGNHLACISIQNCNAVTAKQSNSIVVVHSGERRVLEFSGPTMQVEELMLEFPGFFITELVHSTNTQISTNKAVPMSADQELMSFHSKKPGVAYVLLPMNKTQKPVSSQEWASWTQMVIEQSSSSVIKKQSKSARSRRASNRVAPLKDVQDVAVNNIATFHVEEQQNEAEQSLEDQNIIEMLKEEFSSISTSYPRKHWAPKLETIVEM